MNITFSTFLFIYPQCGMPAFLTAQLSIMCLDGINLLPFYYFNVLHYNVLLSMDGGVPLSCVSLYLMSKHHDSAPSSSCSQCVWLSGVGSCLVP